MANILITDGEQRSALAAARSLGRAGHAVYVTAHKRASLAGSSKYVRATAIVVDPLAAPDDFVDEIVGLVDRWKIDLLLPVTEGALLALLPHRERVRVALPFPDANAFQRICDKGAVAAEAEPLGIKVPRTIVVGSRAEVAGVSEVGMSFPLVIKPHRSVTIDNGTRAKGAVRAVLDRSALKEALQQLPAAAFPVLLQERVVGPGVGIFVLIVGGELHAAFAHRRIREKPPWGGVSVYRESIPVDEDLLERSVALLRRFHFEGAAMVEYKVDERTRIPYIMEINARFWGSLQLAIDAGVDFPALLVDAVLKHAPALPPAYKLGTRSRWFWGDVDSLLLRFRSQPAQDGNHPSRIRACLDFLRAFGPGSRSEVFRLSDPMPAVRETIDWFGALKGSHI